jgi:type VI secretion system secreted protein VgrG
MEPTQADRRISISTPLGDDKLLLQHFSGSEQLGRMFRYDLRLLSTDPDIKLSDLLGQPVTVSMLMPDDETRYFNGYVTSFALEGQEGRFTVYSAIVRPWLWFLTRNADSRIFPEKNGQDKVPGIIMGIFRELGFSDFEDQLQLAYKAREHCVQYRETNFNFVMRLMEDEGIYFYFKHEDGKHTMVLCDDYGSHEEIAGYEEIPFHPTGAPRDIEFISSWGVRESVQTGMVALNDSDFMRPKADLLVKSKIAREHEHAEYEVFDYPGEYVDPADGEKADKDGNDDLKSAFEQVAKTRIEEMQAQFESVEGSSNARGLYAGGLFSLAEHPRDDQNREYLIVSAEIDLRSDDFGSGDAGAGAEFGCSLTAIESKTPFRSQRLTPKPAIQGIQTATIVGPSGETIHTDKYGRVRLQFPWDRYGESNEESSCWVRVSQNWAGPNWGGIFIPHVGQEVIVSFLEGDPDRPIVTGRVYNEDNMPPEELPGAKTKSVIRDHGGNEIIMEGEDGKQQIRLHSPTEDTRIVIGAPNEGNIFLTTAGTWVNRITGVIDTVTESDMIEHIMGDEIKKTDGKWELKIGGALNSITAGVSTAQKLSASSTITAGLTHDTFIGGKLSTAHGYFHSICRGWKREINTATVVKEESDKKVTVKNDYEFNIGNRWFIDAGTEIQLIVGGSLMTITPDAITIEAKEVMIGSTSGDVKITASGDINLSPGGKVKIPKGKFDDGGNIQS